jgi:hypothetical protein
MIILIMIMSIFIAPNYSTWAFKSPAINENKNTINSSSSSSMASNNTTNFYSQKDIFVTTEPTGFGIYDERKSTIFSPGESIILYIEPVGFEYKNFTDENGPPLFSIDFGASFIITSSNGTILGGQENVPMGNIVSHNQNKEVFIPFTVSQSVPFPSEDYKIIYNITDQNSGKSFDLTKDITIS